MRIRRLPGTTAGAALLIVVALVLGACATGGGARGEANTLLRVSNDLVPPRSITVYAVPRIGTRTLVGVVSPSTTSTLRFRPSAAGGEYRFVAQVTGGNDIVSNPVTISPGAEIRWDLSANIAAVIQPG